MYQLNMAIKRCIDKSFLILLINPDSNLMFSLSFINILTRLNPPLDKPRRMHNIQFN